MEEGVASANSPGLVKISRRIVSLIAIVLVRPDADKGESLPGRSDLRLIGLAKMSWYL